tara:strand:+ start:2607 stop:3005 length:399 start_codon:yes stop_codon:yes gene_type:complete
MKLKITSKPLAVLAKELGLPVLQNHGYVTKFYEPKTNTIRSLGMTGRNPISKLIYAPPLELLQKWVREKHKLILICYSNASGFLWDLSSYHGTQLQWSEFDGPNEGGVWKTWEEALEAGLFYTLNRIKNEKL